MNPCWWAAGAALVLLGCVAPEGPRSPGDSAVSCVPGKGQLVVRWSGEGRAPLGSSWAAAAADAYELVLVGTGSWRAADLALGAGQVVAVDPGTYRVEVLAGVKKTPGSTTAYLVGSAGAEAVSIVEGQRTTLELVLRSLDLTLGTRTAPAWKAPLVVVAAGKSRNPRVGMSLSGAATTARPRLKSLELWNGYREMAAVSGTPDDWSAEATATVPDGAASVTVGLVGAGVVLQGLDDQWLPVAGTTKWTWFWPNRADVADTHVLAPVSEVLLSAGPPPTGVDVGLRWE